MAKTTFSSKELATFLRQRENLTQTKARSVASGIMTSLFCKLPHHIFICKRCRQQKDLCRCKHHGYELRGEWRYKVLPGGWECSIAAFVNLPDADLEVLGYKTLPRIKAFIAYLKRTQK